MHCVTLRNYAAQNMVVKCSFHNNVDATILKRVYFFHYCFQINKSTFTKIEENTEKNNTSEKGRATIIFSLKNEVGGLVKALKLFQVWTKLL